MTRYRVYPYAMKSKSAKTLAIELGGKRIRLEGSKYKFKPASDVIINWGNSSCPFAAEDVLNSPSAVALASNKLSFFEHCNGQDWLPPFWSNPDEIEDEDFPIVCRTVLSGSSGAGISIANCRDDLVLDARLFVKYIKKKDEYRVHVGLRNEFVGGDDHSGSDDTGYAKVASIIAVQRKARRLETPLEEVNWQVRNFSNGFIFQREGFEAPPEVLDAAKKAVIHLGLNFGAADVIWNDKQKKAYVLEVNTAPGLEGSTITDYASFFKSIGED